MVFFPKDPADKKVLQPFLTSISNTETWTSRHMFSKNFRPFFYKELLEPWQENPCLWMKNLLFFHVSSNVDIVQWNFPRHDQSVLAVFFLCGQTLDSLMWLVMMSVWLRPPLRMRIIIWSQRKESSSSQTGKVACQFKERQWKQEQENNKNELS